MTREEIRTTVTPRVCYMGNVQTLDTFDGLLAAERYVREKKLDISTSFSNKKFELPKGEIFDCGYIYNIDDTDIDAYLGGIEMLKNNEGIYAFVDNPMPVENLFLSLYAKVLYKVSHRLEIRNYEEDFLLDNSDFMRQGILMRGGWVFNFAPYLKTFWVQDRCGSIFQYKALNQKMLKKWQKQNNRNAIKIVEIV